MAWAVIALAMGVPRAAAQAAAPAAAAADAVLRATLDNGLRVVIVPDRLAPVVSTQLNYLAGSNDADAGFPGTAHALEHMMFRGSAGLDKDQLAELGARLGGQNNANTTETVTRYDYTVPASDLGVALRSEALRMRGLTLDEADWRLERGAIEQEVSRDLSSPIYNYLAQAQAILFAGTPYEHDALGTRPSFDRTDAALLRTFYERWYAPNNAVLVIAGDVQPAAALALVQSAFGDIPRRTLPAHRPIEAKPVPPQALTLATDFPVGLVTLAYRMPGLKDHDFAAADILGDVLGSERGPLYGLVPAGRALLAQFDYQPKADVGLGLAFAAFPTGSDPAPLLADLRGVIARAARGDIPPELVAAAKRQELAQLAFETDSIAGLATSWSKAVAVRGAESPDDLARGYDAVTVADVTRLARLLLDPDHAVTAILTPQDAGHPAAAQGFGGGESLAATPDHPVALPPWAASALAELHPATYDTPDVTVLPNGLRLIVQPEHVSPTVSVYGRVRQVTATQEPAGKEGIAALAAQLFGYGTERRDRLEFRKAVDDIAAVVSAGPDFSLKALSSQFEPGMRLLAENELHPAFPPDAFDIVRRQLAQSVAGLLQSPDYLFERAANKAIVPAGDPALRQTTPESAMSLGIADLRAFYSAAYRPDLTTIVVIGDVTPEQARAAVRATFGDWRAPGPTPAIDLPAIGPNPASQARVTDASSLQDSVAMTETVALPVTSPDRYPFMLGNVILGSGFSSRLYRDLRIKTGYVYGIGSDIDWTRSRASYTVTFGADPDTVERARLLVLRDLNDMRTAPVGDGELQRAKAETLRQLPMQRASVVGIAAQYLRLVELGLPLDSERIAAGRYAEITAAQIQQAFAGALRLDDLAVVVKGPRQGP